MSTDIQPSHYAFLINPQAGKYHNLNLADRIRDLFLDKPSGHTAEVILTESPGYATRQAADLFKRHGDRLIVIACGGDGTAHEVANGLAHTTAAMGILPIGTANDFARTALSSTDPDIILPLLLKPDIRPIDVIRVGDQICLNITSFGLDTKVQRYASAINDKARWLGKMSYPLAILWSLLGSRRYPMHYRLQTVDPQGQTKWLEADSEFILAAICNGRYYGGGFNPAPKADVEDGLLDFCLVDSLPLLRILPLIPSYKNGTHLKDPAVHSCQVLNGVIEAPNGLLLGNYDGELFEKTRIDFQILPKALRFAFC